MCVCARARGTVRPGAGRDSCVQNVWCRCSVCMCVFLNEGSISIRFTVPCTSAGTHLRTLTYSRLSSLLFLARSIYLCDATQFRDAWAPHTQRQRHGVLAMMVISGALIATCQRSFLFYPPPLAAGHLPLLDTRHTARPRGHFVDAHFQDAAPTPLRSARRPAGAERANSQIAAGLSKS